MKPLKQLLQSRITKPPKFWENLAGRSSPSQRDIIAWPMQQRFAHRRNYQKSFSDRGKITSCGVYSTSFAKSSALASKIYNVLSLCPPLKLIEEYCFLTSNMLQLAISSASLNLFFLKLSTWIFPLYGPRNKKLEINFIWQLLWIRPWRSFVYFLVITCSKSDWTRVSSI